MKTLAYLLPLWLMFQSLPLIEASPPTVSLKVNKSFFRIGDQLITLENYGEFDDNNYVLVSLHNDPVFSSAAFSMVQSSEAGFIRLVNTRGKNVEADFLDMKLVFDPNKIFTSWGRREHLKENHCWGKAADDYIRQFAKFILNEIPIDKTVVMFIDEQLSIRDFMDGGVKEKQAKQVFQNTGQDPSTLFITPDESVFLKLKAKNSNVVLQHSKKLEDDGSLHIYCAKANLNYLNIAVGKENAAGMLEKAHAVLQ